MSRMQKTFSMGSEEHRQEFEFSNKQGLKLYFHAPLNFFSDEKLKDLEERLKFLVTLMGETNGITL